MFGSFKKAENIVDHDSKLNEVRTALSVDVNSLLSVEDCHRFLKAKNYNLNKAVDMINKWAVWWNSPLLDHKIVDTSLRPRDLFIVRSDDKEHLSADSFLSSNTGEDKEGRPIYWEKMGFCKFIHHNYTETY